MSIGLFRVMASLGRNMIVANTFGSFALLVVMALGGFILSRGCLFHYALKWLALEILQLLIQPHFICALNFYLFLWQIAFHLGGSGVTGFLL